MAFLRFLIIFFLVLFLLGVISRFLLKLFFLRFARKMSNQNEYKHQEGETFIRSPFEKEKKVSKDTGEYIDFEEIKE